MMKLNVGIIGGGLSGTTAAYELYRQLGNDVSVTIIEKETQLGGRILTKEFEGCPIELGAQFFISGGKIQDLLQSLNLGSEISLLGDNFISLYHDKEIYSRKQFSSFQLLGDEGTQEAKKLLKFAKGADIREDLISCSFEKWYGDNIGQHMMPLLNRMLMSLGVRELSSINAYFGLTLINVLLLGHNYLLGEGLQRLIDKLSEKITSHGGEIIKGAECNIIEKRRKGYRVGFKKDGKIKEKLFHRIISAIQPQDLTKIWNIDALKPLQKIEGYPLALYVIKSNTKLWDKSWGLIIAEEKSPIYILCDWKNVTHASKDTPIIAICSPLASNYEIVSELGNLFKKLKPQCKIIFEKKWTVGLHQPDEQFYNIRRKVIKDLPKGFYIAGDWMTLPALEGAVISGIRSAKLLVNEM
jgi:protoporphyrinogen oxidase